MGQAGSSNDSVAALVGQRAGKRGHSMQAAPPDPFVPEEGVKAKRKRANADQLSVLNAAFERSYFPSTEERLRLSKQTKMCPRTVQIWFQNKRQSIKARTEAMDAAVASAAAGQGRGRRGSYAAGLDRDKGLSNGASGAGNTNGADESAIEDERSAHGALGRSLLHPDQIRQHHGAKRRNSGPLTPSEAVMASLQIQYDDRSVDFSRKRRATIARIEQNRQASSASSSS
ncbi:hypothetical protein BGW38_007001 [Lunasporangiospora selenospora]|uniref:Homeobox domain-containing protein n=1 Tax=Lunasporangiospora selenospora TaxID=979761 RepID=A0A9P6KGZ4_9FUNG|nr:hypothetical protein BGW38_007001 [Lunasporangiospora selenospora]